MVPLQRRAMQTSKRNLANTLDVVSQRYDDYDDAVLALPRFDRSGAAVFDSATAKNSREGELTSNTDTRNNALNPIDV